MAGREAVAASNLAIRSAVSVFLSVTVTWPILIERFRVPFSKYPQRFQTLGPVGPLVFESGFLWGGEKRRFAKSFHA